MKKVEMVGWNTSASLAKDLGVLFMARPVYHPLPFSALGEIIPWK